MTNQQGVPRVSDPIRQLLEAGSLKLSGVGGSVALASGVFGWFAANHAAIASLVGISGLLVGVIGLVFERRSSRRRELRDIEYHRQRMARLKRDMEYRDET